MLGSPYSPLFRQCSGPVALASSISTDADAPRRHPPPTRPQPFTFTRPPPPLMTEAEGGRESYSYKKVISLLVMEYESKAMPSEKTSASATNANFEQVYSSKTCEQCPYSANQKEIKIASFLAKSDMSITFCNYVPSRGSPRGKRAST